MDIRIITLDEVLPIRHCVLWPNKPLSFSRVNGDDTASHYGVFFDGLLVSVASIYIEGRVARLRKFATLGNFKCHRPCIQRLIIGMHDLTEQDFFRYSNKKVGRL